LVEIKTIILESMECNIPLSFTVYKNDVMGVPTVLIARTDADAADLITSDIDPVDQEFIIGERTAEGFYRTWV
jgi:isocitrate lyase